MGNFGSSETRAANSIREIERQRDSLITRQKAHLTAAKNNKCLAAQARKQHDKSTCLMYLRRMQQSNKQAGILGGIITGIENHRDSIEAKIVTSDTMRIMKKTANALSRDTLDASDVDDMMIVTEEHADSAFSAANAMSGAVAMDDEELLSLLDDDDGAGPNSPSAMNLESDTMDASMAADTVQTDESFMMQLQTDVTNLMLPSVPKTEVGASAVMTTKPPAYSAQKPLNSLHLINM